MKKKKIVINLYLVVTHHRLSPLIDSSSFLSLYVDFWAVSSIEIILQKFCGDGYLNPQFQSSFTMLQLIRLPRFFQKRDSYIYLNKTIFLSLKTYLNYYLHKKLVTWLSKKNVGWNQKSSKNLQRPRKRRSTERYKAAENVFRTYPYTTRPFFTSLAAVSLW